MAQHFPPFVRRSISRSLSKCPDNWKVTKVNTEYGSGFLERLSAIWKREEYTDITLVIGNAKIRCHRIILAAFSDYFEALFGSGLSETSQTEVELKDVSVEDVKALLNYAYSGEVEITAANVESLLDTAGYFGVLFVIQKCSEVLYERISVENCLAIYRLAIIFSLEELQKNVREYVARHFGEVIHTEDFLETNVEELVEFLMRPSLLIIINGVIPSHAEQSECLVEALLRWAQYDEQNRRQHFYSVLLKHIDSDAISDLMKQKLKAKLSPLGMSALDEVLKPFEEKFSYPSIQYQQYSKYATAYQMRAHRESQFSEGAPSTLGYITAIDVYISLWDGRKVLGGLKLHYNSGESVLVGSETGRDVHKFSLNKDERINKIIIGSGWLIDRIGFFTNRGRKFGPFGGDGGNENVPETPEDKTYGSLVGVKGWLVYDQGIFTITDVQFIWQELTNEVEAALKPIKSESSEDEESMSD